MFEELLPEPDNFKILNRAVPQNEIKALARVKEFRPTDVILLMQSSFAFTHCRGTISQCFSKLLEIMFKVICDRQFSFISFGFRALY